MTAPTARVFLIAKTHSTARHMKSKIMDELMQMDLPAEPKWFEVIGDVDRMRGHTFVPGDFVAMGWDAHEMRDLNMQMALCQRGDVGPWVKVYS